MKTEGVEGDTVETMATIRLLWTVFAAEKVTSTDQTTNKGPILVALHAKVR